MDLPSPDFPAGEWPSQQVTPRVVDARETARLVCKTLRAQSLTSLLAQAETDGLLPGPILHIDYAGPAGAIMLYQGGKVKPDWDGYISTARSGNETIFELNYRRKEDQSP